MIWGVFWGSRGAPRSDLGFGRFRDASGASLGRLRGASGAPPGRLPGALWAQVGALGVSGGSQHGAWEALRMDPRTAPVSGRRGNPKMEPKWTQNGTKMEPRWGQLGATLHVKLKELERLKTTIFLVYFQYSGGFGGCKNGPENDQKWLGRRARAQDPEKVSF